MKALSRRAISGYARGTAALAGLAAADAATACSVCFGNPEAPMTQAAQSGMIVMLVVTYGVIAMFGAAMTFWLVRSRRLSAARPDAPPPCAPGDAR